MRELSWIIKIEDDKSGLYNIITNLKYGKEDYYGLYY
jgi:hypothetical protein